MADSEQSVTVPAAISSEQLGTPIVHRTVIRPSRGWVALNLGELWDLPRAALLPRPGATSRSATSRRRSARPGRSSSRCSRWSSSASSSGGSRSMPSDGMPVPALRVRRRSCRGALRVRAHAVGNSLVAQPEPDHQGLLPAADHPARRGARGPGRLRDRVRRAARDDGSSTASCRGPRVLAVPLVVLLAVVTALAVGLWLSALNVQYRDVRYTSRSSIQLWLFADAGRLSRAASSRSAGALLYGLNPMVGRRRGLPLGAARRTGRPAADGRSCRRSARRCCVLVGGLFYFRRDRERRFADRGLSR